MRGAWTLRTDGGARGNPGPAGSAFVLADPSGAVVAASGRYLGVATNNVAEYEALLFGLEAARALDVAKLVVLADSELMVKQVRGEYKVRNEGLRPLHRRAGELIAAFDSVELRHVRREENVAADALANEAMDSRADVGDPPPAAGPATLF